MKVFIFVVLLMMPPAAFAALGGTVGSINSDSQVLRAKSMRTVAHARFTVHEISYGATKVREYVNANGIVFAIAWNGLSHPDLSTLLGTYSDSYNKAIRSLPSRRKGSRFSRIKTADHLVVERGGHMRNVRGRAYDMTLFPAGVSLSDIQ